MQTLCSARVSVGLTSLSLFAGGALAQPQIAELRPWSNATEFPSQITSIPGDTSMVFGVDRLGRVRAVDAVTGQIILTGTNNGNVLDLRGRTLVQGDGGLLAAAFPANFNVSRSFYVYYNRQPDNAGVLSRFTLIPGTLRADMASEQPILVMARPNGHNGGWIGFSPTDGYLYVALGDAGTAQNPDPLNRSQTVTGLEFAGKILRLDVSGGDDFPADPNRNYRIPPTNPFVGSAPDDEIWAYGLRNPWRCDFDNATGALWIGDVGQEEWEEINFEPAGFAGGRNYGWKCREGPDCTGFVSCACSDPTLVGPLFAYSHADGCSISPGVLYRGSAIPGLVGKYLYTDWCSGRIWSVMESGGVVTETREWTDSFMPPWVTRPQGPSAICEDASGELYVLDHQAGYVFKLFPVCAADFNRDGFLDFFDYDDYVRCFELSTCPPDRTADFNNDAFVDFFDYDDFVSAFEFGGC